MLAAAGLTAGSSILISIECCQSHVQAIMVSLSRLNPHLYVAFFCWVQQPLHVWVMPAGFWACFSCICTSLTLRLGQAQLVHMLGLPAAR